MRRLIGVGVGPGDPELVTVKAVRVLREADVVLVPVLAPADSQESQQRGGRVLESRHSDGSPHGRAETIIRAYVDSGQIKRLQFALNDTGGVTPRRAAAWQAAAAAVAEEFAAGANNIAFGTLGDPNLYSTFSYLAQTVRHLVPGLRVETVAGITAMQDLASRAGISLAEGTEPVTLVPLNGGPGLLDQALASGGTVVGYKVGAAAGPTPGVLRDRLSAAGRLADAVIGARLGLEGEFIAPAANALAPAANALYANGPAADVTASAAPMTASAAPAADALPPAADAPPPVDLTPIPPAQNIPDIPYLSTLIVPACRASRGASLAYQPPIGKSNRLDVTLNRTGPAQRHIEPVEGGAPGLEGGAPEAEGSAPGSRISAPGPRTSAPGPRTSAPGPGTSAAASEEGPVGRVFFVGAGPGAPDLLTLRGAAVIATADVVIWASSLVHPGILKHVRRHAEIVDSARLPMEGVLPYYERAAQQRQRIARIHSGDPSLWGAVQEQLERCHALGLDTEIVPGVSSFTAVAARIGRELTIPEVAQSVILTRLGGGKTPMPPGERVAEFARHGTTMALFLSAARSGQLQDELLAGGYPPDTPCVVAYQVTWPDELIARCDLKDLTATMKQRRLWRHTLVLVGPALAANGSRSHLYHPGHFHGYRRADPQARKRLKQSHDTL